MNATLERPRNAERKIRLHDVCGRVTHEINVPDDRESMPFSDVLSGARINEVPSTARMNVQGKPATLETPVRPGEEASLTPNVGMG